MQPLIALLLFATPAHQMPFDNPGAKINTLMLPEVQKEIKMTGEQRKQLNAMLQNVGAASNPAAAQPGMGMVGAIMAETDAKAIAILDDVQRTRLHELWLQYEGPTAVRDKQVAEAVKLTDEQRASIESQCKAHLDAMMQKMMTARSKGAYDEMKKMRKELTEHVLALLTAEQQAALTTMQGKPFKFRAKREY